MNTYMKREKIQIRSQKSRTNKPKINRSKEIANITSEVNKIDAKIQKINETKSWFCGNINTINKPLARLIKEKREKTQIINSVYDQKVIIINTTVIQKIVRDYF